MTEREKLMCELNRYQFAAVEVGMFLDTHPCNKKALESMRVYTEKYKELNPEKYQDLQIRVCGWNVLWNNINKKEQDGFIRQAEGLI